MVNGHCPQTIPKGISSNMKNISRKRDKRALWIIGLILEISQRKQRFIHRCKKVDPRIKKTLKTRFL